jgi:hypothetical protein
MDFMRRKRERRHTPDNMPEMDDDDMPPEHAEMPEEEHKRTMRAMASKMMGGRRCK